MNNNEEKVQEILHCENCKKQLFIGGVKCPPTCTDYNDLMKMAQWKDEQIKQEIIDRTLLNYDESIAADKGIDGKTPTFIMTDFEHYVWNILTIGTNGTGAEAVKLAKRVSRDLINLALNIKEEE